MGRIGRDDSRHGCPRAAVPRFGTPGTDATHYRRFACEAGARRRGESYDTVAIHFVIRVLASGDYVLENVRFLSGPGVP